MAQSKRLLTLAPATRPALIDPNQRYTIPETNALLRQSNAKTYIDIRQGRLRVLKDGARTYVLGAEIIRRSAMASP